MHKGKVAVVYAHHDSDAGHRRPHGRAAVGQEQKRNSCNRHYAHYHSYVDHKVKEEKAKNARRNVIAVMVGGLSDYQYHSAHKDKIQNKDGKASQKAGFLGKNAEDKVGGLFGQKTQVALGSAQKAFSKQAAGSNRGL